MRKSIWLCSCVLAWSMVAVAAGSPPPARDLAANVDPGEVEVRPPNGSTLCTRPAVEQVPPNAMAIVVLAGPLSNTLISYEIWNYSDASISAVNIDGFDALTGQGLLFHRVATAHAADVGSVRLEYPQPGVNGRGPIVLSFKGFGPGQCAAVDAEASTWGDAGFRGRIMDAVGTRIEMVFEGGARGDGEVVLCGSNGRFSRDVPCHPGDGVALISGSRTMQVRLSQ